MLPPGELPSTHKPRPEKGVYAIGASGLGSPIVAVRSDISAPAVASAAAAEQPRRITARSRHIVGLTIAAGLLLTLLLNSVESLEPSYQNRSLHAAKETAAALVLLLVAALLIGRFRRAGRLLDLLALAGVVVLAGENLIFSVLTP